MAVFVLSGNPRGTRIFLGRIEGTVIANVMTLHLSDSRVAVREVKH